MKQPVPINCDMGEGLGLFHFGQDDAIMPHVQLANVACGFHGGDANHMRRAVRLAKANGVTVGAHPSLPDLQGFGRREMQIGREELANLLIYQIGALDGLLKAEGMRLGHIKAHGALYGMAARQASIAHALCDAADVFKVPLLGLAGTMHETIFTERGHAMLAEFFADLGYDDDGGLIITREHTPVVAETAVARCMSVVAHGSVQSVTGRDIAIRCDTICVHSDTPNAVALVEVLSAALRNTQALMPQPLTLQRRP